MTISVDMGDYKVGYSDKKGGYGQQLKVVMGDYKGGYR